MSLDKPVLLVFYSNRMVLLQTDNHSLTVENSFTPVDGGKWMCRLCCALLGTKQGMERHLKGVHLKEKKYPCRFCDKRFGYSSHARSHERKCPQRPTADAAF